MRYPRMSQTASNGQVGFAHAQLPSGYVRTAPFWKLSILPDEATLDPIGEEQPHEIMCREAQKITMIVIASAIVIASVIVIASPIVIACDLYIDRI